MGRFIDQPVYDLVWVQFGISDITTFVLLYTYICPLVFGGV